MTPPYMHSLKTGDSPLYSATPHPSAEIYEQSLICHCQSDSPYKQLLNLHNYKKTFNGIKKESLGTTQNAWKQLRTLLQEQHSKWTQLRISFNI